MFTFAQSVLRFFKQFSKVARQVVTTSLVSAFVGFCFTSLMSGKAWMAREHNYPVWTWDGPGFMLAFIFVLMLTAYGVFLWAGTDSSVQALEEEGFTHRVEILGRDRQVVVTYWSQAKWKMVALVLSPMLFCAPAGWLLYPGYEQWQTWLGIPVFCLGWAGWWFGWWRLFKGAEQSANQEPGLVVYQGGRKIARR